MSNIMAVQFNGWNFGYIYDWTSGKQGLYTADFRDAIDLNGKTVHRNDWVVKNEDGTFTIMSNMEFQNKMDKEYYD
jgi:hypothetical protein